MKKSSDQQNNILNGNGAVVLDASIADILVRSNDNPLSAAVRPRIHTVLDTSTGAVLVFRVEFGSRHTTENGGV